MRNQFRVVSLSQHQIARTLEMNKIAKLQHATFTAHIVHQQKTKFMELSLIIIIVFLWFVRLNRHQAEEIEEWQESAHKNNTEIHINVVRQLMI